MNETMRNEDNDAVAHESILYMLQYTSMKNYERNNSILAEPTRLQVTP